MSSREEQVKDILVNDPLLVSLTPGGIYTDQEIGIEGIHRGTPERPSSTQDAFDEDGFLRVTITIRQGGVSPRGEGRDQKEKMVLTNQNVSVFFYQERGQDQVALAIQRSFELLEGIKLTSPYGGTGTSWPLIWLGDSAFYYDVGPVANSTVVKQDWLVVAKKVPVNV